MRRRIVSVISLLGVAVIAAVLMISSGNTSQAGVGFNLGVENSWLRVQNIGSAAATTTVQYLNQSGGVAGQEAYYSVQPGASLRPIYQLNSQLPSGFRGGASILSSQKTGTLVFRDISSNGRIRLGGEATGRATPQIRSYLPLILRNYGWGNGWGSRIHVQNTSSTQAACVKIAYFRADNQGQPGPFVATDPSSGCISIPPLGSIRRDVTDFAALGDGFLGSAQVNVAQETTPGVPIIASADIFNRHLSSFSSYTGSTCRHDTNICPGGAGLSTDVLLPVAYKNAGYLNQWQTYFAIQTHNNSPANVSIEFNGRVGGTPFQTTYGPFPVGTSRICYFHAADVNSQCRLNSNNPLPDGFVGTARVRSGQPLAVVATRSSSQIETYSSYSGFQASALSTTVNLPLIERVYGWRGRNNSTYAWNTWFQIQVADGSTANLVIKYYNDSGVHVRTDQPVVNGFLDIYQLSLTMPENFIGSAVITSNKPIAVVANTGSYAYTGDSDAMYEGIPP